MVYGAECWAVRRKEERKLHTTEMRMLWWARGKTRLDHVRNVDIRKEDGLDMCNGEIKMRPRERYNK